MSLMRQFVIRNELLYSGFVLPNVQIFFVQKISFATFGVSIDDFLDELRWCGLQPTCYHSDGQSTSTIIKQRKQQVASSDHSLYFRTRSMFLHVNNDYYTIKLNERGSEKMVLKAFWQLLHKRHLKNT